RAAVRDSYGPAFGDRLRVRGAQARANVEMDHRVADHQGGAVGGEAVLSDEAHSISNTWYPTKVRDNAVRAEIMDIRTEIVVCTCAVAELHTFGTVAVLPAREAGAFCNDVAVPLEQLPRAGR